jgi:hypothetical protein
LSLVILQFVTHEGERFGLTDALETEQYYVHLPSVQLVDSLERLILLIDNKVQYTSRSPDMVKYRLPHFASSEVTTIWQPHEYHFLPDRGGFKHWFVKIMRAGYIGLYTRSIQMHPVDVCAPVLP